MSKIEIRAGTEGPRHDPYSFREITVTRADGREATVHIGLAEFVKFEADGREYEVTEHIDDVFASLVGISIGEAERFYSHFNRSAVE